jgi:hypothetical protein
MLDEHLQRTHKDQNGPPGLQRTNAGETNCGWHSLSSEIQAALEVVNQVTGQGQLALLGRGAADATD